MFRTAKSALRRSFAPRLLLTALSSALLLALFFGATAYAQDTTPRDTRTWTDTATGDTFTFSTPDIFNSCSTRGDRIYTIGMQPGWRLEGTVTVRQPNGSQIFSTLTVDQTGELDLLVPYPPVSQWQDNISNREIHVDLSIVVLDENGATVSWIGDEPTAPGILGPRQQDWDVFCLGPLTPDITIKKYTNGADADDPTAAGVPLIAAGAPVTWTYRITNTGPVDIPLAEITVTDNIPGVSPVFTRVVSGDLKGDGNGLLQPNEVWEYTATGTAVNLANPPGGQGLVLNTNACQQGNASTPGRNAYTNIGTVLIPNTSASDPSSYCNLPVQPTGSITSVCVNGVRTWTVSGSESGAYVVRFTTGSGSTDTPVTLIANTPAQVPYSGDSTQLTSVTLLYSGFTVATYTGPFTSCVETPTGTLTSICVEGARTWTVTVSQGGAYVVEFLVNGTVASTTNLTLVANTPATFTYSGDPTTLSGVRVTLNGAVIVAESGSYESCVEAPTGTLTSVCVDDVRTWTVNVSQSGAYVAEFLVNGTVASTTNLTLVANTPATFTYSGDPTTLSGVRVTLNGTVVAAESGPYESCVEAPTGTLTSVCVDDVRTWTANVSQTGTYTIEFVDGGSVVQSESIALVASQNKTFTYSGDATLLDQVRIVSNGATVAFENGPYESCVTDTPTVTLAPRCADEGLLWSVTANQTGTYVAQVVSNGVVIEETTLTLTANQPQDVAFGASSYTPNVVRILFQGAQVLEQTGPESCVDGLSAAMVARCAATGTVVWTVLVNRTGSYVAQLMSGQSVLESQNLSLTDGIDEDFAFTEDSTAPRFVRLLFQGAEYARLDGLDESCVPTSLPPTEEPNLPVFTNFIFMPAVRH